VQWSQDEGANMFEKIVYAGVVFMGFSAIMNPFSGVSIFLTLTANEDEQNAKKIARISTTTAFIAVVVFAVAGHLLLDLFGVSFTALRLAGGILVALIGYEMLQGKQSLINNPSKKVIKKTMKSEGSVAVTPLGIPLLAGPGVIITAMNFSTGGIINLFVTIFAFALLCVITYLFFIWGKHIKEIIGLSALKSLTRMMGLILIVIGTQMFIEGVYGAVQEFSKINY